MIILVMAIGFTVDYSAHIAHAFVFSRKSSAEEKVINALSTVGASVFMGGKFPFKILVIWKKLWELMSVRILSG